MAEEKLATPQEKEGTESGGRNPLIVQVWTIRDCLTSPSHMKLELEEEIHQYWHSQWQEFLKNLAGLPAAAPPLEEDAKDLQFPLGGVKEEPSEESTEETRGESVLQRDLNASGKAWMGREKLDFCVKVKTEESLQMVDLESQWPFHLRQFDAEEHQEVSNP
ncbi:hypothetical protein NXF25_004461 [Crotalus adamanteus]|uniref:Uncharacterized protein n=1 Tax=Crotalus adamanteus TaxID=8729 RepID=A0AAW1BWG1_CROAD